MPLETVLMEMFVWWEAQISMRVEWKCVSMTSGGQSVMTPLWDMTEHAWSTEKFLLSLILVCAVARFCCPAMVSELVFKIYIFTTILQAA